MSEFQLPAFAVSGPFARKIQNREPRKIYVGIDGVGGSAGPVSERSECVAVAGGCGDRDGWGEMDDGNNGLSIVGNWQWTNLAATDFHHANAILIASFPHLLAKSLPFTLMATSWSLSLSVEAFSSAARVVSSLWCLRIVRHALSSEFSNESLLEDRWRRAFSAFLLEGEIGESHAAKC